MHATMRLLSIKWLKKVAGPVMNPRHPPQFHPGTLEITLFLLLLLHRGSNPVLLEIIPQTLPLYHQQITLLLSKKTNHQQIMSMEGLKVPPHYTGKQSPYNILLQLIHCLFGCFLYPLPYIQRCFYSVSDQLTLYHIGILPSNPTTIEILLTIINNELQQLLA